MDETLRFRAWISIPLKDGRECGFYIYDVDLYRHGAYIGFTEDDLRLATEGLSEADRQNVRHHLNIDNSSDSKGYYTYALGTVEQCTGATDSSGVPIYYGDNVRANGNTYTVTRLPNTIGPMLLSLHGTPWRADDIFSDPYGKVEVIGSIHQLCRGKVLVRRS